MYPVLFRIGGFEVTSFGVMVAAGALVGLWLFQRELARRGLPSQASDGAVFALLAGLAGAKLLWVYEHFGEDRTLSLLLSRGGLSWFGGLVAGLLVGIGYFVWRGYRPVPVLAAATPGLAAGHAIGRIGCFLVGDDYGRPTSLPWGVAFPEGLPPTAVRVHPTQIYEALGLALLAILLLRWRRRGVSDRTVLGGYLLAAGLLRFAIEFLRIDVRVVAGLSVAHLGAIVMAATGVVVLARGKRAQGSGLRGQGAGRRDR
jgi:phosphatidylglycerol:prolipoprotein diacylglycerol transferase